MPLQRHVRAVQVEAALHQGVRHLLVLPALAHDPRPNLLGLRGSSLNAAEPAETRKTNKGKHCDCDVAFPLKESRPQEVTGSLTVHKSQAPPGLRLREDGLAPAGLAPLLALLLRQLQSVPKPRRADLHSRHVIGRQDLSGRFCTDKVTRALRAQRCTRCHHTREATLHSHSIHLPFEPVRTLSPKLPLRRDAVVARHLRVALAAHALPRAHPRVLVELHNSGADLARTKAQTRRPASCCGCACVFGCWLLACWAGRSLLVFMVLSGTGQRMQGS